MCNRVELSKKYVHYHFIFYTLFSSVTIYNSHKIHICNAIHLTIENTSKLKQCRRPCWVEIQSTGYGHKRGWKGGLFCSNICRNHYFGPISSARHQACKSSVWLQKIQFIGRSLHFWWHLCPGSMLTLMNFKCSNRLFLWKFAWHFNPLSLSPSTTYKKPIDKPPGVFFFFFIFKVSGKIEMEFDISILATQARYS